MKDTVKMYVGNLPYDVTEAVDRVSDRTKTEGRDSALPSVS